MSVAPGEEGEVPPPEVLEWYERFGGVSAGSGGAASSQGGLSRDELLAGGIRALGETLARTGRNRDGAYALLAADGLLTDAVLAGADSGDAESAFREILAAIGREVEEDRG